MQPGRRDRLMLNTPLSALDLPLKNLLLEVEGSPALISFKDPSYLAARYRLHDEITAPIRGVAGIADAISTPQR
jgi:uncharacterized protein (DUF302 family)